MGEFNWVRALDALGRGHDLARRSTVCTTRSRVAPARPELYGARPAAGRAGLRPRKMEPDVAHRAPRRPALREETGEVMFEYNKQTYWIGPKPQVVASGENLDPYPPGDLDRAIGTFSCRCGAVKDAVTAGKRLSELEQIENLQCSAAQRQAVYFEWAELMFKREVTAIFNHCECPSRYWK